MQVSIQFNPHFAWIGVYWEHGEGQHVSIKGEVLRSYRSLDLYICILPCLPINIFWKY